MRVLFSLVLGMSLTGVLAAQDPVRRIKLEDMQFENKVFGKEVRRLHAAIEKLGPKWDRQPFQSLSGNPHCYLAEWCNFRDDDPNYNPWNYFGPDEVNYVTLVVYIDPNKGIDAQTERQITGARIDARWKPAHSGWAAQLAYAHHPSAGHHFECRWLYYPDKKKPAHRGFDFDLHYAWFVKYYRFGMDAERTLYLIDTGSERRKRLTMADEKKILATPESLRDHLVDLHQALAKRIEKEVLADRGFDPNYFPRLSPPSGDPLVPVPSQRKLTAEEKQQIIKEAKSDIDERIASIRNEYKEIHVALRKTFPIQEFLTTPQK